MNFSNVIDSKTIFSQRPISQQNYSGHCRSITASNFYAPQKLKDMSYYTYQQNLQKQLYESQFYFDQRSRNKFFKKTFELYLQRSESVYIRNFNFTVRNFGISCDKQFFKHTRQHQYQKFGVKRKIYLQKKQDLEMDQIFVTEKADKPAQKDQKDPDQLICSIKQDN